MSLATLEEGAEDAMLSQAPVPIGVITAATKTDKIKEIAKAQHTRKGLGTVIRCALMDNVLYRRIVSEKITIKQALEEIKKDPSAYSDGS